MITTSYIVRSWEKLTSHYREYRFATRALARDRVTIERRKHNRPLIIRKQIILTPIS